MTISFSTGELEGDEKPPRFHRHLTKVIGGIAAVAWGTYAVGVGLGGGRLNAFTTTPFGEDLLSLHAATRILGETPAGLYMDEAGRRVQAELLGPVGREVFNRYMSPPHTAWLFAPLGALSFSWVLALWSLLSLAALAALPSLLETTNRRRALLGALIFAPVLDGFAAGQNAIFTVFLFALGFALWRRERGGWTGIVVGLVGAYKPHLLAGPALLFVLEARRDPRPLLGLLGVNAGLLLVDVWRFPAQTQAFFSWGSAVMAGQEPIWSQLRPGGEFTVGAFFQLLLQLLLPSVPWLGRGLSWAVQAAAAVGFVALYRVLRPRRQTARAQRLLFAAMVVLTLALTPHAHLYEWTLLLVPGFLLWREIEWQRNLWAVTLAVLALTPIAVRLTRLELGWWGMAVHLSLPLLIAMAVTIGRLGSTLRRRKAWRGQDESPASPDSGVEKSFY